VKEFIANTVEMLMEDTSGQLMKDSSSAFHSAVCTNASTPAENDAHRELELDMLKHMFSSPTARSKNLTNNYSSLILDNAFCRYTHVHEILNL
jgi:hypothetical protein